jgi:glutaredoxin-like YruB-family protein
MRRDALGMIQLMKQVIMYSTPTCVYCKMAKQFFTEHGVQYAEHNVADDLVARAEMVEKSHQLGVPVIDIGGEIFVGFDRGGIARALGIQE